MLSQNIQTKNIGIDDSISERKTQSTIDEQLRTLQQQSTPIDKNESLINTLLSQKNLPKKSPIKNDEYPDKDANNLKNDCNELENEEQSDLDEEEDDEKAALEEQHTKQQNSNFSNILQMMQKEQQQNEQQQSEEDEEMLSEDLSDEDKFAALLNNNAQLQQLLLSSTSSSTTNNTQPSTSNSLANNSKVLNLYEELVGQSNNQQQEDYERFAKAVQQHQLIQQLEQEEKLNKLNQLQNNNNPLRKRNNSIYTKLYQCNICEYNTRWLSNLYAHEKRRHNTCTSSQGNLKVITVRRDIPSPNSSSTPNRLSSSQMNLNNLLMGLENNQQQQQQKSANSTSVNNQGAMSSNCINDDILNQLNDFNNNNFVNLLQQNDSAKATRPIKERTASGDGQFVCTICQRSYRHKHSLQRHLVCHRNQENNNSSLNSKIGLNQDQTLHSLNFKTSEQHTASQSPSNDLNGSLFTPPANGTSTPSFLNTGRSSVDSEKSGEHNLKQQQIFSQEILESLISGPNSSILNNLIGANSGIHSPNNSKTNYSSSPANDNTPAMFSV